MMQPGPYGIPNVRLNLVNVIFAVDLTQARSHYFLASTVNGLIARKFPLRFGIVPIIGDGEGSAKEEDAVRLAKAVMYLHEVMDWPAATTFMKHVCVPLPRATKAHLLMLVRIAHLERPF